MAVGYYEAFNNQRPCLQLDVPAIKTQRVLGDSDPNDLKIDESWSHIHFAFANITEDFDVDVSAVKDEFEAFTKFTTPRAQPRVLSFGGWSFSTSLDSYAIFRKGVTDAQRQTFATNVVNFATDNNLNGLDFDWEYPGAPDIPGIPAGDPGDGQRYLEFLKMVKNKLPSGMTLSIAAPASYWYLKGFPIKDIADVVDYIVFMTYDLHGQWDWNNTWSDPDCPDGGCLRSHVNHTEILNSFSMITKAGVPNNKVVGGVASYGRSFGMKDTSCAGPQCHFTGPKSGAQPGDCTKTPGYIANAEIQKWLNSGEDITSYWDEVSRSNISYSKSSGMWVAYNDQAERDARMWDWWLNLYFAGTSLWAVDLTEFVSEWDNGTRIEPPQAVNCSGSFDNLDDLEAATDIDDFCMNTYIMQALSGNLTASLSKYQDLLDNDYDEKFGYYVDAVKKSAPNALSSFTAANASTYFTCYKSIQNDDGSYTNHTDKGCFSESIDENDIYWVPHNITQFEDDLMATSGISADWLKWGVKDKRDRSGYTGEEWTCHYHGVPMMKDDYTVNNPKDVISKRLPNIKTYHETLDFTAFLSQQSMYSGEGSDVVDGSGMLVFMVSSSVANMAQVAEIGQNAEDQEILNIVLWFVSAVLFIIPGLEEGAVALDLANLARMLRLIGTAGDAGMSVYDIVQSKGNAPAAIFGLLLGGLSMAKAPKSFSDAAKARRGMRAADIESLGTQVKGGMGQVDKLVKRCF